MRIGPMITYMRIGPMITYNEIERHDCILYLVNNSKKNGWQKILIPQNGKLHKHCMVLQRYK